MNADQPSSVSRREPLTLIVAGPGTEDAALVLELHGLVDSGQVEAVVQQVLDGCTDGTAWRYRLRRRGPAHHTLTLEASDAKGGAPDDFPVGLLADLLTAEPTAGPPEPVSGEVRPERERDTRVYADPNSRPEHGSPSSYEATHGPVTSVLRASPLQRELLAGAESRPGAGIGIGQLTWEWYGPLDLERFAAAWQSVHDRESVLRAAFDGEYGAYGTSGAYGNDVVDLADSPDLTDDTYRVDGLRIVVHEWVTPDLLRLSAGAGDWPALVARDRERALDPRRPGPLRVTLLEGGYEEQDGERPHRMLLTYHHALLDDVSARLLLREFFRAYLAGGRLPGGERRPDIGDYSDWLYAQDLTPAREFWSQAAPPAGAADFPVPPTRRARTEPRRSTRRARYRLTSEEAEALRTWAARWGATEFGALQAAWALLLHRASGADAAAPVAFSVSVSGRGVPLDSVDRMPGALRNSLPLSLVVDPGTPVPCLLSALCDRTLDTAAYEWVSAGQIAAWADAALPGLAPLPGGLRAGVGREFGSTQPTGGGVVRGSGTRTPGTLLVFKGGPRPSAVPVAELAAQGIRVSEPTTHDADTAFPLTLTAHHDAAGGLVLTVVHDPARLRDADGVLADVARLLRRLPRRGDPYTSAGSFLDDLAADGPTVSGPAVEGSTVEGGRTAESASGDGREPIDVAVQASATPKTADPLLRTLRPASGPAAAVVCLVPAPGLPQARYEQLALRYAGSEPVVLLSGGQRAAEERLAALAPLLGPGRRLVLGGFSGSGTDAYAMARLVARADGRRPPVVLAAAAMSDAALARTLAAVAAREG
jgi:condensation domain-containing protein